MRDYQTPKGPLQTCATALFVVGLALSVLIAGTPWVGIALMLIAIAISIALLFTSARRNKR